MPLKIQEKFIYLQLKPIWHEEPQTILWDLISHQSFGQKLPGSKSAGRVQSVALKLITEREKEIELFKPEEYWTLTSDFTNKDNKNIFSKLSLFNGEKIEKFSFKNKDEIQKAVNVINKTKFKIADVNTKVFRRNPLAPFTTSTLQQTASGRFGFGASRTMQIAQRLYQGVDMRVKQPD